MNGDDAMKERAARLCRSINERLDALDGRTRQVREAIAAMPIRAARVIEAKLDEARQRADVYKAQFRAERARVNHRVTRILSEGRMNAPTWKASRDIPKLSRHAERAENYAMAAVLDACGAVNMAEVAILEALQARLAADEAESAIFPSSH